jgi:uncharacterized membrane protein SirB2
MYATLKLIHIIAATLTISGFLLRGFWMLSESPNLNAKAVRIAPHVIDSIFLFSGIGLIGLLQLPVLSQPWLMAKLLAVVIYIILGMIALRRGKTMQVRVTALLLALATFAYIVGVALSKSTGSWLALAFA